MVCSVCGAAADSNAKFCTKCGADLSVAGVNQVALVPAPDPEKQKKADEFSKKCVLSLILGIVSIMLSFSINSYAYDNSRWYISLIYLILSAGGFALGIYAMLTGLKGTKIKAHAAMAAMILGIVGASFCGIKLAIDLSRFINLLGSL